MKYKCPICENMVPDPSRFPASEANFFPFCSQRCKLIDLGSWFDADYQINTELFDNSDDNNADR